jgi:hypothetical protein
MNFSADDPESLARRPPAQGWGVTGLLRLPSAQAGEAARLRMGISLALRAARLGRLADMTGQRDWWQRLAQAVTRQIVDRASGPSNRTSWRCPLYLMLQFCRALP